MEIKRYNNSDNSGSIRALKTEEGQVVIEGYAAIFNQRSKLLFEDNKVFFEVIKPGAFDRVLSSDSINTLYVYNHHQDQILARTKSGTLSLSVDDTGLKYRAVLPNTTLGNDIAELVNRGDLFENSFRFSLDPQGRIWQRDSNGDLIHIIREIRSLMDVSIVVNGAYSDTKVMLTQRDLEEIGELDTTTKDEETEEDVDTTTKDEETEEKEEEEEKIEDLDLIYKTKELDLIKLKDKK